MDRKYSPRTEVHYHIRWSGKAILDWESFSTRAEAEAGGSQLVRPGETFIIEEHDGTCLRCRAAFELKTDHAPVANSGNPQPKYPWQQAVIEAATESRPEYLPIKVNAAQRAISARLCDKVPAELDEQLAIREALILLRRLAPATTESEEESGSKTQSA